MEAIFPSIFYILIENKHMLFNGYDGESALFYEKQEIIRMFLEINKEKILISSRNVCLCWK
jgi:hypothetical protein